MDATVKLESRLQGLVKAGSYDAFRYESGCDKAYQCSQGSDTAKKKKNLRLRELSDLS